MTIPIKVQDLFNKTDLVAVATTDNNNIPNVVPIYWKKIIDNSKIIFINNFMKKTKKNVQENENLCVSFWDGKTEEGYKLIGTCKHYTKGDIFELGKRFIQEKCPGRIPKGVIMFNVKEIYDISPGENAGKIF